MGTFTPFCTSFGFPPFFKELYAVIIKFCDAGRERSDGSDGLVCLGGRCPPRFDFCQVLIFIV